MGLAVKCCNRLYVEFSDLGFITSVVHIHDDYVCYIFNISADHKILRVYATDPTEVIIIALYTGNVYCINQISDLDDLIPRLWEFEIPRAMACIYLTFNPNDLNRVREFCVSWNAEYWKYKSNKLIVRDDIEIDNIEDLRMAANDRYRTHYTGDVQIPEPEYYFL